MALELVKPIQIKISVFSFVKFVLNHRRKKISFNSLLFYTHVEQQDIHTYRFFGKQFEYDSTHTLHPKKNPNRFHTFLLSSKIRFISILFCSLAVEMHTTTTRYIPNLYSAVHVSWHFDDTYGMLAENGGCLPGEASEYDLYPFLFLRLSPFPNPSSFLIW